MKKKLSLLLTLFFIAFTYSQGEANIWYFGQNAGLKFETNGSVTPLSVLEANYKSGLMKYMLINMLTIGTEMVLTGRVIKQTNQPLIYQLCLFVKFYIQYILGGFKKNNMKSIFVILTISFIFIGCSSNKTNEVTLELLNKEVYFAAIDTTKILKSYENSYEKTISYTNEERNKACNVLTYKLINNSNKKYYFVLNMDEFDFYGNSPIFKVPYKNDSISIRRMCFLIANKNGKRKQIYSSYSFPSQFESDSMNIYYAKQLQIESKIFKDKYNSFFDEVNTNNSFVLCPGEYKIFKRKLYLPIYVEKDYNKNFIFNALILNSNDVYDFSIGISTCKNDIWSSLQDYQRKEIEDNKYEIYDGVITSNKIPLLVKK